MANMLNQLKSSHRGRLDIMANILRSTAGGVRKTSIMYKCNLSFKQLEVYLSFLMRKDLLKMFTRPGGNSNRFFETTERGLNFLQAYRNLEELMTQ